MKIKKPETYFEKVCRNCDGINECSQYEDERENIKDCMRRKEELQIE